jgi:hypothetical protein
MADNGSEAFPFMTDAVVLLTGNGRDAGGFKAAGGVGRSRLGSLRLDSVKGIGDFEGDGAGFVAMFGLTHDRSAVGVGRISAAGYEGVEFFKGEPCGVGARTVEDEHPRGDSGLLKGDARCDAKVLEGVPGLLCALSAQEWVI